MLLLSVLLGAWRGLVFEVLSVLSWVAAFVLAQWLAPDVAHYAADAAAPASWCATRAGFVLVFIATVLLGGLLAALLKKLMAAVGLRPVDRMLGAAFGVVRGVLLLLLAHGGGRHDAFQVQPGVARVHRRGHVAGRHAGLEARAAAGIGEVFACLSESLNI